MRVFRREQGYRQLGHQPAELFRIGPRDDVRASGRLGQVMTAGAMDAGGCQLAGAIDAGDCQPADCIRELHGLGRTRAQCIGVFYVCKIERNHHLTFASVLALGVGRQI